MLERMAAGLGAHSAVVILCHPEKPSQLLYRWPPTRIERTVRAPVIFLGPGSVPARIGRETSLASALGTYAPGACSFLLSACGITGAQALVALGFREAIAPASAAEEALGPVMKLIALAALCVQEVHTARAELAHVSERLGGRKIVEQAKRLLQGRGCTEQQAYEHLRRLSRQQRKPMHQIAKSFLQSP
ncbi:MAG TPA: ANTAR domain-containing protein [Bryobacteraceae bacterium]|nr:ANTAR domain-containing protein [Bryobacteraceae bacterium]